MDSLSNIYYFQGQPAVAGALAEEALTSARAIGRGLALYLSLLAAAGAAFMQRDEAKAKNYMFQLLALAQETGRVMPALFTILGFGALASSVKQAKRGIQLLAAFESLFQRSGVNLSALGGGFGMVHRQFMQIAQVQLDPADFEATLQEGRALTLGQALTLTTEGESEFQ